ncbi:MAG: helix-hairpin-helix domain-containing protein [Lachnospiraceae bacterium]|nr:helix-hairpin-helix domain-containing protein [Lachnospiraceae bacterium]
MHTWKKWIQILLMITAVLFLPGCGSKNTPELQDILQNTGQEEASGEGTAKGSDDGSSQNTAGNSTAQGTETAQGSEPGQDTGEEKGGNSGAGSDSVTGTKEESTENKICVFVCGEVVSPGVYYFPEGARKVDAVEAAGGFTEEANKSYVNLAELLTDEMQLYIPAQGEETGSGEAAATETQAAHAGQINLNTATLEELCTLSGIGESKAQAILSYREEHGGFTDIEELKEVSGIGDSTFEKIKESIYVE